MDKYLGMEGLRRLASLIRGELAGKADNSAAEQAAKTARADGVTFADGQTFQQKCDAGELTGPQGERGETGAQGPAGPKGEKGDVGAQGPQGPKGADGAPGRDGVIFTPAVAEDGTLSWSNDGGLDNPSAVNLKGPQGDTGPAGPQGDKGDPGAAGGQGPAGPKGEKGDAGPQGPEGPKGADGAPGPAGPAGPQGADGEPGADGAPGKDGDTWVPSVDGEGNLSWEKNSGVDPSPVNIKGDAGPAGPQGPAGKDGAAGTPGRDGAAGEAGKSAYDAAREGGYSGGEAQFNADLAAVGSKQDKLTGKAGQIVGFDESGKAVPQAAPAAGMTQAQADERYVRGVAQDTVAGPFIVNSGAPDANHRRAVLSEEALDLFGGAESMGNKTHLSATTLHFYASGYGKTVGIQQQLGTMGVYDFTSGTGGNYPQAPLNVADPTQDTHAATKKYVDGAIQAAIQNTWKGSY